MEKRTTSVADKAMAGVMLAGALGVATAAFATEPFFQCCHACPGQANPGSMPMIVTDCVPCVTPLSCSGYCQSSEYGTPIATAICGAE